MMEGLYLKQFLVAHSNIEFNDCMFLYEKGPNEWDKLSTDERLDYLAELQIKHAEAIMRKLDKATIEELNEK